MDDTIASVQAGTTVPAGSAVPALPARPAVRASTAAGVGNGTDSTAAERPAQHPTSVTVEHDKNSGHNIVSIVDAVTREVLVQVPPAGVRAVIEGLLEMVHERQERA